MTAVRSFAFHRSGRAQRDPDSVFAVRVPHGMPIPRSAAAARGRPGMTRRVDANPDAGAAYNSPGSDPAFELTRW